MKKEIDQLKTKEVRESKMPKEIQLLQDRLAFNVYKTELFKKKLANTESNRKYEGTIKVVAAIISFMIGCYVSWIICTSITYLYQWCSTAYTLSKNSITFNWCKFNRWQSWSIICSAIRSVCIGILMNYFWY